MTSEPHGRLLWPKAVPLIACFAIGIAMLVPGCSTDGYRTAMVTGSVSHKGRPVVGLYVRFAPVDGQQLGRPPSLGITGTDGRYVLFRPNGVARAVTGPCTVTFSTPEGHPCDVPPEAFLDRTFEVEVSPGRSEHDFDL